MANQTLIIDNVDLELLEQQRHALIRHLTDARLDGIVCDKDFFLLDGLLTMLDNWADERDGYVK
jgi:hypothetical protein